MRRWLVVMLAGCDGGGGGGDGGGGGGGESEGEADADAGAGADADAGPACEPVAFRPGARSEHTAVLDETGGQVIVYGGSTAVPEMCSIPAPDFTDAVWLLDERCGTWREATGDGDGPGARARHMAAWDEASRRMIVFGGRSLAGGGYAIHNDLWAFDAASGGWSLLHDGSGEAPDPRAAGALGYDAADAALWLFGGDAGAGYYEALDDTWRFDTAAGEWQQVDAGAPPAPRVLVAYAFDPAARRLYLFGGADETAFNPDARYFNDLWALDVAAPAWTDLESGGGGAGGGGPDGRFYGGMAVDPASGLVAVFGGHDATALGNRNDLWTWQADGGWREVSRGDTFNAGAVDFCDFPADFAAIDVEMPERRGYFGFASGSGRAWIFSGKTDCGAIDDVWRLDFASLRFAEVVPALIGETCARRNDGDLSQCSRICF